MLQLTIKSDYWDFDHTYKMRTVQQINFNRVDDAINYAIDEVPWSDVNITKQSLIDALKDGNVFRYVDSGDISIKLKEIE